MTMMMHIMPQMPPSYPTSRICFMAHCFPTRDLKIMFNGFSPFLLGFETLTLRIGYFVFGVPEGEKDFFSIARFREEDGFVDGAGGEGTGDSEGVLFECVDCAGFGEMGYVMPADGEWNALAAGGVIA